jgi:hypothetical protein
MYKRINLSCKHLKFAIMLTLRTILTSFRHMVFILFNKVRTSVDFRVFLSIKFNVYGNLRDNFHILIFKQTTIIIIAVKFLPS